MFMADSWFALRHPEYDRDFERNRPNRHPLKSSSYMNFRNNTNAHESKNGHKRYYRAALAGPANRSAFTFKRRIVSSITSPLMRRLLVLNLSMVLSLLWW